MTNLAQFLLVVVIITLTLLLVFVAFEAVLLLRDIRAAVKQFNGKSPKELSAHLRRFFHQSGRPLKPS
ncbi:MAG: hypothetical protein UX80_C0008G0032 [Candidatus Amesbacteria bacterium GW2011_GWA2_47_11b]|uniref:Uncharacterized protein n=3 Tax=Candidatus Amesiibacteriota TaxID=1752730 RepID=A0A0G1SKT1_9BACT|nr:MAG: hypothetical protein UX42_C0002G0031 [Microgenomates group bacterium GW2011_GWC1_46_20]KKU57919.1 MAG: hypothetical protein UX80_C0008G0032 [Candidatus Amesbacteria bacterium GW2011_GWA2_47_11b]KKU70042.1 MAG: hypothetical protein UX92_C0005G0013 [Candidatus Amesbacteria bacterium GW2011_GWA1_47_20]KKU83973.1 MAG: hypothetical protein UY11_C0009G0015 [Candidatus Amesbacteria bacterium GW2011_GWC2_47_8]